MTTGAADLDVRLVGDGLPVPCLDGTERPYLGLDAAASTSALPAVAERVAAFLPEYSSVHRGAGWKSQRSTAAFEDAREAVLRFAGASDDDVAIICRNTTEALNHLAYRLRLEPHDVVVTTVAEHHANLLPWRRTATERFVECEPDGTFSAADVVHALDAAPRPRLLAITGASNITGWMPPLGDILPAARERGIPVVVDAAQLAPHRPLPAAADFVAFSGHKLYAPFGAGALVGPRSAFTEGDPFLAGGGAVDLVDLDEVVWTAPPDREEAGSPNVIGAVALGAAIGELARIGMAKVEAHDRVLSRRLHEGLRAIPGVRVLGPGPGHDLLPVASFVVEGAPHALVAARLSAEFAIGVRHGCFCAHPYLIRLLGLGHEDLEAFRAAARRGDRHALPGAVRASAGLSTTTTDLERLFAAVTRVAAGEPPVPYALDPVTGDYTPEGFAGPGPAEGRSAACAPG
jgi:selenocysteine lyase/cysteine desulfurase